MPLSIDISPERSYFRPGDMYRAEIDLINIETEGTPSSEVITVLESITICCRGTEYIDPSWVSPHYLSTDIHQEMDKRRVAKPLFKSPPVQILERLAFLPPGGGKRFSLNCILPSDLPPAFKGTSVRYSYELEVLVAYRDTVYDGGAALRRKIEKQEPPKNLSLRKGFNVWPRNTKGDEIIELEVKYPSENEYVLLQWTELFQDDDGKTSSRSTEASIGKIHSDSAESSSTAQLGFISGSMMDSRSIASRFSMPESEMSYAHAPPITRNSSLTNPSDLSCSGQMLTTASSNHQMFNLRFGDETLVLFSFNPSMTSVLHPGATLGGVLHLSEITLPNGDIKTCQGYTVMLETEEEVNEAWKPSRMKQIEQHTIRRLHCEHVEYTSDVLMTNFMFTIPSNAPISFKTPLVSLRWLLRFEFVVGSPVDWVESGDMQRSDNRTESLHWELPIVVHAQ